MMKRAAFKLKLKEGFIKEYQSRHESIWPKLKELLSQTGVSDYSIYLDEKTLTLFGSMKLSDDNTMDELPNHPLMREWWDYMADIMEVNPDNSPLCTPLKEVFHME